MISSKEDEWVVISTYGGNVDAEMAKFFSIAELILTLKAIFLEVYHLNSSTCLLAQQSYLLQ